MASSLRWLSSSAIPVLVALLILVQLHYTPPLIPENKSNELSPQFSSIERNWTVHRTSLTYRHNNRHLVRAAECTDEQRETITRQLQLSPNKTSNFKLGYFRCPEPVWLEDYLRESNRDGDGISEEDRPFVAISIGCNKGQDAIKLARLGFGSPLFDVGKWIDAINMPDRSWKACGKATQKAEDVEGNKDVRSGEVHCVEPMPANFVAMRNTSDALGLTEEQGWILTQAAVSSVDGMVDFPMDHAGREDLGIHDCDHPSTKCVEVPLYSLESYVSQFVKSSGPIDVLSVDVEGWDFDVLFGAGSVLDRTKYLEFEYHGVGHWKSLSLPTAVELLDTKGFTCYWAAKGELWRVTGCDFEYYHQWHGWSNIACVHRSHHKLAAKMEGIFLHTLTRW